MSSPVRLEREATTETLVVERRQARRHGSTIAIAAIDLDHFKAINDTRGHAVGDVVLRQVAGIMLHGADAALYRAKTAGRNRVFS